MQKPTQVVGRRVAAFVIDLILWAAVIAIAWYALTKDVGRGSCVGGGITINGKCHGFTSSGNRAAWLAIIGIVSIAVFVVMQGLTGKTPGKAMLGIKVVNGEGNPPGILRTTVRELLWVVDIFLVALVAALASQKNQRLGDMVAGTYVVDRNFAGAIGTPAAQPAQPAQPAAVGPPPPQGAQPANWYPDPHGQARLRYWDGERWTEHTSG
jgi:uncharacterized RDD family membrane protein YckC